MVSQSAQILLQSHVTHPYKMRGMSLNKDLILHFYQN